MVIGFFSKVRFAHQIIRYLMRKRLKKICEGIDSVKTVFSLMGFAVKIPGFPVHSVRDEGYQMNIVIRQIFNTINLVFRELIFHQEFGKDRNFPAG